jgi:hypothetical protein
MDPKREFGDPSVTDGATNACPYQSEGEQGEITLLKGKRPKKISRKSRKRGREMATSKVYSDGIGCESVDGAVFVLLGHLLLYTFSGSMAVWMPLSGFPIVFGMTLTNIGMFEVDVRKTESGCITVASCRRS